MNKNLTLLLVGAFFLSIPVNAETLNGPEQLRSRCPAEAAGETPLRASDFHWNYELPELIQRFAEIKVWPRRLSRRAFWDEKTRRILLPYDAARSGPVAVPANFILSVQKHVEEAFRLKYVDGLFFPDMGHSHFLVPTRHWSTVRNMPVPQMARSYEFMMGLPDLKILYHTAEQLRFHSDDGVPSTDRRVQWRFFSRNLVGDNRGEGRLELHQNPEHRSNTVQGVAGYEWWGAGFNISANDQGCFAAMVDGVPLRFDLSLYDLEYAAGGGDGQ